MKKFLIAILVLILPFAAIGFVGCDHGVVPPGPEQGEEGEEPGGNPSGGTSGDPSDETGGDPSDETGGDPSSKTDENPGGETSEDPEVKVPQEFQEPVYGIIDSLDKDGYIYTTDPKIEIDDNGSVLIIFDFANGECAPFPVIDELFFEHESDYPGFILTLEADGDLVIVRVTKLAM